jgi:predicted nuclease with RNAse H fold
MLGLGRSIVAIEAGTLTDGYRGSKAGSATLETILMARDADVFSIDLPWGDAKGRTAIASRSLAGVRLISVIGDDELLEHIRQHATRSALVLLDVPIDGCEGLGMKKPRREVDDRFLAIGLPILPSVKSGTRGPELAKRIHEVRTDLRVGEIYPYAVLRVLWALQLEGKTFRFDDDMTKIDLCRSWWAWPPKYKRAKSVALRLEAMRLVASVISAVPGLRDVTEIPPDDVTGTDLARRADGYDALLGLVAGISAVDDCSWSWHAKTTRDAGAICSIADAWVRRRFADPAAR